MPTLLETVPSAGAGTTLTHTLNAIPRTREARYTAYLYSGNCYKWSHHNTVKDEYYQFKIRTPKAVRRLNVTQACPSGRSRISVSWAAPDDSTPTRSGVNDTIPSITGYAITYENLDDATKSIPRRTLGSTTTSDNSDPTTLEHGTRYKISVEAENALGSGSQTSRTVTTCARPISTCDAPLLHPFAANKAYNTTAHTKSLYGDDSLTPRWSIPNNVNGATEYQIEVSTDPNFAVDSVTAAVDTSAITDNSHTLTGRLTAKDTLSSLPITNGTTYHIRIRAKDTAGICPWSNKETGKPFTKPPLQTLNVTVTGCVVEATLTLNPLANNGSRIFAYRITIGSNTPTILNPPSGVTSLSTTHTYTTNGSHAVVTQAQNNDGWSDPTSRQADLTTCTPPPGTCVTPTLTITPGDGELEAAWTHPTATRFNIRHKTTGAWTTHLTDTTKTTDTIPSLTNGTTYTIAVFAITTGCNENNPAHWAQRTGTPRATGTPPGTPTGTPPGPTTCTVPPSGNTIPYECPTNTQGTA